MPEKEDAREDLRLAQNTLNDAKQLIRRLERLIIGGCAGGSVAVLSVMGGFLSQGTETPIPSPLYWVLVIFLAGLSFAKLALAFEFFGLTYPVTNTGSRLNRMFDQDTCFAIQGTFTVVASMSLTLGIVLALAFLYQHTG